MSYRNSAGKIGHLQVSCTHICVLLSEFCDYLSWEDMFILHSACNILQSILNITLYYVFELDVKFDFFALMALRFGA